MNTTSPSIFEFGVDKQDLGNTSRHRFFRSRNLVEGNADAIQSTIIRDKTSFDEAFHVSIRKGLNAARRNTVPGLLALCLMALIATAYLMIPMTGVFFNKIAFLKSEMGMAFPFIGMGLSVGLLSEFMKVRVSETRQWTLLNTKSFAFLFIMFGVMASAKDPVYVLLARLYGEGMSPGIVIKKVLFDQFVWTVFLACPYQTLLFSWKAHGFSFKSLKEECPTFSEFFALKILPVLITNWCFWFPMTAIIYLFPTDLQLAVSIIAISLWVCLLNMLTVKAQR